MSTTTLDRRSSAVDAARRRFVAALSPSSVDILRISLGLIFLAFGVLKYVPGLSPAEEMVTRTVDALSFGMVGDRLGMILVATLETFIGLSLITGRLIVFGLIALGGASIGFFAPLFLFTGDMFGGGPALEAQYIAKDLVLVAAALVVALKALGARFEAAEE